MRKVKWRQRTNELERGAVIYSDFISGGETVNVVSKILDGLTGRDKSFSRTVKSEFESQGIGVNMMGNSPGDRL